MKQSNLKSCNDELLVNINGCLEYILSINDGLQFLSRSEQSIIKNWKKQISKEI